MPLCQACCAPTTARRLAPLTAACTRTSAGVLAFVDPAGGWRGNSSENVAPAIPLQARHIGVSWLSTRLHGERARSRREWVAVIRKDGASRRPQFALVLAHSRRWIVAGERTPKGLRDNCGIELFRKPDSRPAGRPFRISRENVTGNQDFEALGGRDGCRTRGPIKLLQGSLSFPHARTACWIQGALRQGRGDAQDAQAPFRPVRAINAGSQESRRTGSGVHKAARTGGAARRTAGKQKSAVAEIRGRRRSAAAGQEEWGPAKRQRH